MRQDSAEDQYAAGVTAERLRCLRALRMIQVNNRIHYNSDEEFALIEGCIDEIKTYIYALIVTGNPISIKERKADE